MAVALVLTLAACGSDDDSGDNTAENEPAAASPSSPSVVAEEPADEPASDPGTEVSTADSSEPELIAADWIRTASGLSQAQQLSLAQIAVERTGAVSHVRFQQLYHGYQVDDAELIVHVLGDGSVQGATSSLSNAPEPRAIDPVLSPSTALATATKAITGQIVGDPQIQNVWLENAGALILSWRVDAATQNPLGVWTVYIDATQGMVLRATSDGSRRASVSEGLSAITSAAGLRVKLSSFQGADRCPLPAAPAACVFVPDPLFASAGTLENASDANDFLTPVVLQGLDDPTSGALVGEFANLEPASAPVDPTRQPDGLWGAGRGDPGFEAQNVYYWIDYGQRTVQRLGFDSMLNRSFPVIPIDPQTVDNAFYSSREELIFLGVGSNGIHEGEDASGILHEYGHALLDAVNPNLLGGGDVGAYHEGFGDLFAALVTIEYRQGDWPCFFMWTDQRCLRRMDTPKVYPGDLLREVHADGEIYTSAIHDILAGHLAAEGIDINTCPGTDRCGATRDRVLTTVLASNYYLTAGMSMPDIAEAYVQANDAQFGGADQDLIQGVFDARGLGAGGGALMDSSGSFTGTTRDLVVEFAITHSFRGDLNATVGVVDAEFAELCTPIAVFVADPSDDAQGLSGELDLSGTDCAALGAPGPDRVWFLLVEDTFADDEGEIVSFRVIADGTPYLAPGLPLPIADADPDGSAAFIDGSIAGVSQQGASPMGGAIGDGPFITLDLQHDYHGDLLIRAGVAAADGTITCSVSVLDPDASDSTAGPVGGDIDMSECASLYPPSSDDQWFIQVSDNAAEDTGSVVAFSVNGPDGQEFAFADVPAVIPDDDVDGIALLLDGSSGTSGQAGGAGQQAELGLPRASIEIDHPFAGDLAVTGGVVDAAGDLLCQVTLHSPDPVNDAIGLTGDISLAACARFYPPTADRQWFLFAADTLTLDTGAIVHFSLFGPDGAIYTFDMAEGGPIGLPDADPDGVALFIDNTDFGLGAEITTVASVVLSHPYVGDLDVVVGVAGPDGAVLCTQEVSQSDLANDDVDLAVQVALTDCAEHYPPTADERWFLSVVDTAEFDRGSIAAFVLYGPDGIERVHPVPKIAIPDNDPDGTVLFFDGQQPPGPPRPDPVVSVMIEHGYRGDLRVTVGITDADRNVLCEHDILRPNQSNDRVDFDLSVAVPECANISPAGDNVWYLLVSDEDAQVQGQVTGFSVVESDGSILVFDQLPVEIPDDDADGIVLIMG